MRYTNFHFYFNRYLRFLQNDQHHDTQQDWNECIMHYDNISPDEIPSRQPTLKCTHDINVCSKCLEIFLKKNIEKGNWRKVRCPDRNCQEPLEVGDVELFAPSTAFHK